MNILILRQIIILSLIVFIGFGCAGVVVQRERHVKLQCVSCHDGTPVKGRLALKNRDNPSDTCRSCHPYTSDEDHHPSDPEAELIGDKCAIVDPSFPLVSGRMECLTCHKMHAENISYSGTKHFLRGGPYAERRDICFRCHKKELYQKLDPHNEMVLEGGALNYATCLECHLYPPDPTIDTFKTVKFRASVAFLCWRCHAPMVQDFLDKHYLKKPSKKTMEEKQLGEMMNGLIMPLDSKERVTCSTCHNPHQPGVMISKWAKKGEGSNKRLRTQNLCAVCHSSKAL